MAENDFGGSVEGNGAAGGIGGGNASGSNGLGGGDGGAGGFGSVGGPTVDLGPGPAGLGAFGALDTLGLNGAVGAVAAGFALAGQPEIAAAIALSHGSMQAVAATMANTPNAYLDLGQLASFNSGPF